MKISPNDAPDLARAAWLDTIELFAGTVAKKRFRGQSEVARLLDAQHLAMRFGSGALTPNTGEDAAKILLRLRWLDRAAINDNFIRGWEEAERALRPHWKRVVELGRWLHQEGYIDGAKLLDWWQKMSKIERQPPAPPLPHASH